MPIIGTPVTSAPPADTCETQNIVAPVVSRAFGQVDCRRMRSVQLNAGQEATIEWTMVDQSGNPIDLTGCGIDSGDSVSVSGAEPYVVFRIRESMEVNSACKPTQTEYTAVVHDAVNGLIRITLPPAATGTLGVYFAEVAIMLDETVQFSNLFYVIINRSQFGGDDTAGPPTMAEIRLHLRDSGAATNILLDDIAFDDAEIALAIKRPVEYWNEIPPDLGRHNTQTFPYRFHWLEAICANLFWMTAEQFRRNELPYQAAGISVNDQSKAMPYEQAAEIRWQRWVEFVQRKKAELNMAQGWGMQLSPYSYLGPR